MEEIEEMFREDTLKADPTEQNIRLTSIKASFDHSFNGLSFDLRQLLVKLTLFQSPFPISAVKQIFGFDRWYPIWYIFLDSSKSIHHTAVKGYLTISVYGLLLLFASNQATVLINSPYHPFGMAAISFVGLSSYLIFIGIYSSAASVAQDIKLRKSIRNSVERQLDLLHNIGTAEMEKEIMKKVFNITKTMSIEISKEIGVELSLQEKDISDYLVKVIKEIRRTKDVGNG